MTDAQTSLHWRIWGRVCATLHWKMVKGRLDESALFPCEQSRAVRDIAGRLAFSEHRAITADDLRHACYRVAAKKQSHTKLNNADFNRLLILWKLLINPDDLQAIMARDNPEIAERVGLVKTINAHAPAAYIEAITTRKHKTIFWEDLPIHQLRQLAITIKERVRKKQAEGIAQGSSQSTIHSYRTVTKPTEAQPF